MRKAEKKVRRLRLMLGMFSHGDARAAHLRRLLRRVRAAARKAERC